MLDLVQNTPNSIANEVDEVPSEKLQVIQDQLTNLVNKYVPISRKYPQSSEIKPEHADLKDLNKDLKEFLSLEIQCPAQEKWTFQIAYLFLTNDVLFKALSYPVLKQLILRHETAKKVAISIFKTNSHYDKASLLKTVSHFQNKQKLPNYNTRAEDQAFIFFLLSQPNHAVFFNFNELVECFTEVNDQISYYIYKLALSFDALLTDWLITFKTSTSERAPAFIAAMAPLAQTELEQLLPTDNERNHLFALLNTPPGAVATIIEYWPSANIQWLVGQLCLPLDASAKDEVAKKLSLEKQNVLGQIMEGLFLTQRTDLTKEFAKYIKQKEVLENTPRKYIENCLQKQSDESLTFPEKQQSLILAVAKHSVLLPATERAFLHLLCLKANKITLASLLEKQDFQTHFAHTATHTQASSLFQLINETEDNDKVDAILTGATNQLQSLSSAELLQLATDKPKGRAAPLLSSANLKEILKNRPNDFVNDSAAQRSLNFVMDCVLKENKMSRDLFKTLMTHRDFQEAWLRSKIFDPNWNSLGQGLFNKKIPTTIAKARHFLNAEGKNITPLSPQRLNSLIDMLKTAKEKSYKYSYWFGSIDFRDRKTQAFYNQAAEFPCTREAPTANMHNVQL